MCAAIIFETAFITKIQHGLQLLGEPPDAALCESLLRYLSLLSSWNQAYNLTSIQGTGNLIVHHVNDSLSVLPYIKGDRCLDVGSGAGLPGMVIALARPQQNWILLDSNRKKVRFLNQVILELGVKNVQAVYQRIEDYRPEHNFTTIISRALTNAAELYQKTRPFIDKGGRILLMKGRNASEEIEQLQSAGVDSELHALKVPGLDHARQVIVIDVDRE